jgi:hypothetical protein
MLKGKPVADPSLAPYVVGNARLVKGMWRVGIVSISPMLIMFGASCLGGDCVRSPLVFSAAVGLLYGLEVLMAIRAERANRPLIPERAFEES